MPSDDDRDLSSRDAIATQELPLSSLVNSWGELIPIHTAMAASGFAVGDLPYGIIGIEIGAGVSAELIAEAAGLRIIRHLRGHQGPRLDAVLVGEGCVVAYSGGGKNEGMSL